MILLAGAGPGLTGVLGCDPPEPRAPVAPHAAFAPIAGGPQSEEATLADLDDECAAYADEPEQWLPKDCPPRARSVEYVKMSDWTPPPSVQAVEAAVPPRGDVPPTYIQFPRLTKHSSIGGSHFHRR